MAAKSSELLHGTLELLLLRLLEEAPLNGYAIGRRIEELTEDALSIDEGSWPLFEPFQPDIAFAGDGHVPTQWQVPADAIRPDAYACQGHVRYLVFPKYEASVRTELVAMTRGEALVELAKNTFRFREHGRRALSALAGVVEGSACYRLPVGDLGEAVALVEDLVAS